jgi:hypothetical protein
MRAGRRAGDWLPKTEFNGVGRLRTYITVVCRPLLPAGASKLRPQRNQPRAGAVFFWANEGRPAMWRCQ